MDLQQIQLLIRQEMAAVESTIVTQLRSKVALINQLSDHMLSGGGKRLRPMIVILAARALDTHRKKSTQQPVTEEDYITAAVFIEFIHTATLLHDDVVDGSKRRRGKATAHATFGNAASVLVGDFIYTRAFQMMTSLRSQSVLQLMAETTNKIAEGEVMQLMHCYDLNVTEVDYLQVIYRKTACLFEAAAQCGALLAQATMAQQQGLKAYGRHLGTAFQLMDDLLDYCAEGSSLGKNLGDDLNEGKMTLPLLHAMRCGTPAQSTAIRQIVTQDRRQDSDHNKLNTVLAIMQYCDSFRYVQKRAEQEVDSAIAALQTLPDTPYCHALASLAGLVLQRAHSTVANKWRPSDE